MKKSSLFSIKEWEWTLLSKNSRFLCWEPDSEWGSYRVTSFEGEDEWWASYCFAEYHDEGSQSFDNLEDAKEWCWLNWLERLSSHLILVEND